MDLKFLPIDIEQHSKLCTEFRADAFKESFGTTEPFYENDGQGDQRYIDWPKKHLKENHGGFHLWYQDEIIGQLELGRRNESDDFGYVYLYYLMPEMRGRGFSSHLDTFAEKTLKEMGFPKARLAVSPTNLRAIKFYEKSGWIMTNERRMPAYGETDLKFPLYFMEKVFP